MELKVGDKYRKIVDVMNTVFGWNYKSCFKGFYYLDDAQEYGAWFPKFAKGPKNPGDIWYGWVNVLSADKNHIYMKNYDNSERMEMIDKSYPYHITFGKKTGGTYEYLGVYKITHIDPELGFVFERVKEDINVDDYHFIPKTVKR